MDSWGEEQPALLAWEGGKWAFNWVVLGRGRSPAPRGLEGPAESSKARELGRGKELGPFLSLRFCVSPSAPSFMFCPFLTGGRKNLAAISYGAGLELVCTGAMTEFRKPSTCCQPFLQISRTPSSISIYLFFAQRAKCGCTGGKSESTCAERQGFPLLRLRSTPCPHLSSRVPTNILFDCHKNL